MPAKKRRPGCLTKKTDACKNTKKRNYRIITVVFRIIPYNIVLYRIMCLGTWQLQWAKGLLGPLGKIPKIKTCVRLGHLAVAMGKGGGGWHVHTRNAETHSHAQSRGGGGHQPYSKHS